MVSQERWHCRRKIPVQVLCATDLAFLAQTLDEDTWVNEIGVPLNNTRARAEHTKTGYERCHYKAVKHLGIRQKLDGALCGNAQAKTGSFFARLGSIKPHNLKRIRTGAYAINALCCSMISYAPLLSGLRHTHLLCMDQALT